jgi:signal transduction histidine kinase/serine phosphatase RsbU (regulator of sigma subunit)
MSTLLFWLIPCSLLWLDLSPARAAIEVTQSSAAGVIDLESSLQGDATVLSLWGPYRLVNGRWVTPEELLERPQIFEEASRLENLRAYYDQAEPLLDREFHRNTFLLALKGLDPDLIYAIKAPLVARALRIWIVQPHHPPKEPVLSIGILGESPKDTQAKRSEELAIFRVQEREAWILLQAEMEPKRVSPATSITLGPAENMLALQNQKTRSTYLILGILVLIALFNAGLYLQRPEDKGSFYLFIVTFWLGLRFIGTESQFFVLFPQPSTLLYEWNLKVNHLTLDLAAAAYLAFLLFTFPQNVSRLVHKLFFGFVIFRTALTLLTPVTVYGAHWSILFLPSMALFPYIVSVQWRAARHREDGALWALLGLGLIGISFVNDYAITSAYYKGPFLGHWGIVAWIFCQCLITGQRFANAFRSSVRLSLELGRKNDELKEKDMARTLFFHNTSHELRTPLNGILGFVDLMRNGAYGPMTERAVEQLDKVHKLADGLKVQVNTILDIARSKRGQLPLQVEAISLDDVLDQVRVLAEGLDQGGEVSFRLRKSWPDTQHPSFSTDRERLLIILRNLLGNAFKFRRETGKHEVEIEIQIEAGSNLVVVVRDNGIGIPADQLTLVFEEFRQIEGQSTRAYEGSGLGLSMVQTLVQMLKGRIEVKSEQGRGSEFTCYLPALRAEDYPTVHVQREDDQVQNMTHSMEVEQDMSKVSRLTQKAYSEPQVVNRSNPSRILIIDDNPLNLEVLNDLLYCQGYECQTAQDGREGLRKMREQLPDLVLLDLMMPHVSGEDVIAAMREDVSLSRIPVIILTARASEEDKIHGLELGADDYLAKPFMHAEVLLRVRNLLNRVKVSEAKAKVDSNLEAARMVQEALLPQTQVPNFRVASYYKAAEETGGDWYYYHFSPASQIFYCLIGDVTGHGISSAMMTGAAAGSVHSLIANWERQALAIDQKEALQTLVHVVNRTIFETGARARHLMTMTFLCIDARTGQGMLINAGHMHALHRAPGGVQAIVNSGSPLGLFGETEHTVVTFQIKPNDMLFLYTDGLIENEGIRGERIKARELSQLISEANAPEELRDRVLVRFQGLLGTQPLNDDMTFLIIQWEGPSEQVHRTA